MLSQNTSANHARSAGHVSATTKVSIPIDATSLMPVPTRNDRNDPTPTISARRTSVRSRSNSPAREQPRDQPHRGADHSGPRAAEELGHVAGQKIVDRRHRGRQPRPQPHRGGRQRRVAARIGAEKSRKAQHGAGQHGHDTPHDARETAEESQYGEEQIHLIRKLSLRGGPLGAADRYSASRLVAVSGNTTHGRNVFASSNSIRA